MPSPSAWAWDWSKSEKTVLFKSTSSHQYLSHSKSENTLWELDPFYPQYNQWEQALFTDRQKSDSITATECKTSVSKGPIKTGLSPGRSGGLWLHLGRENQTKGSAWAETNLRTVLGHSHINKTWVFKFEHLTTKIASMNEKNPYSNIRLYIQLPIEKNSQNHAGMISAGKCTTH